MTPDEVHVVLDTNIQVGIADHRKYRHGRPTDFCRRGV
jgi:hypothetical protein